MIRTEFSKVDVADLGDTIQEFYDTNRTASDAQLQAANPDDRYVVIGCSDARVEETAIAPKMGDKKPFMIKIAGSAIKNSIELPFNAKHIAVLTHEHEEGNGYGASRLARMIRIGELGEEQINEAIKQGELTHRLVQLARRIHPHTRTNAIMRAGEVTNLHAGRYETIPLVFNHTTGKAEFYVEGRWMPISFVERRKGDVIGSMGRFGIYTQEMGEFIAAMSKTNLEYAAQFTEEQGRLYGVGQNPALATFTGIDSSAADIAPSDLFRGSDKIFEVKPGGSQLTKGAKGSLDYVFGHALRGEGSFENTGSVLLLVRPPIGQDVAGFMDQDNVRYVSSALHFGDNAALAGYLHREGQVVAAIVDPNTNKIAENQFYELKKV